MKLKFLELLSYIIAIAHDKGGVGKTTTATNIIVELLNYVDEISVIDLDPKKHLTWFVATRKDPRIKLLTFETVADLRKLLENNKGVLVMDVAGLDSDLTRNAIAYSDRVITPVLNSQIELNGLNQFKSVISSLQRANPDLRSSVLLHRINPRTNIDKNEDISMIRKYIENNSDIFELLETVIRYRVPYQTAYGYSQGVAELDSKSAAAQEIKSLIKEL
jgi:chromosome partitioning protein